MSGSKYETTIDLSNRNNSHALIMEFVGSGKRVLDVGTATGYVAQALVQQGCAVTGIELDPEAAKKAEEHCERVIVGDVEGLDLRKELGEETFDVILFGDVLEHLRNPLQVLSKVRPFLSSEGYVVASIPNIAHGSVRLALLQGEFRYRPLGLLDDTHLRFFTRENIEEMFAEAGYVIAGMERTRQDIFHTEVKVDRERVTQEMLETIRKDPEAETYQFVFAGYPVESTGVVAKLSGKLSEKEVQIIGLRRRVRELEKREGPRNRRQAGGGFSEAAEGSYDRAAIYGFARWHAEGKSVACVSAGEVGYGVSLLAENAAFVTGITGSSEALEEARGFYTASNVGYEHAHLPEIPYPPGRFDVAVISEALERTERPEELVEESRRVLKEGGVLILSTPDKQVYSNERNHHNPAHVGEMYVPELQEMLGRHFERVAIYRQGAVAGATVFKDSENGRVLFESPPPETRFVMAVCGGPQAEFRHEESYPLMILDREIFDENEEQREDIELLKGEIRQMQQIEVQAFQETLKTHKANLARLKGELKKAESNETEKLKKRLNEVKAESNNETERLKKRLNELNVWSNNKTERLKRRLDDIESSRSWRTIAALRQLRASLRSLGKLATSGGGDTVGRRPDRKT